MNNDKIRERIKRSRKIAGLTQEYMGVKLGISTNSYRELERGSTGLVNPKLELIAALLNVSLEYLIFGSDSLSDNTLIDKCQKKYERIIDELKREYRITIAELEGEIKVLKTNLETKERVIGVIKEESRGTEYLESLSKE